MAEITTFEETIVHDAIALSDSEILLLKKKLNKFNKFIKIFYFCLSLLALFEFYYVISHSKDNINEVILITPFMVLLFGLFVFQLYIVLENKKIWSSMGIKDPGSAVLIDRNGNKLENQSR